MGAPNINRRLGPVVGVALIGAALAGLGAVYGAWISGSPIAIAVTMIVGAIYGAARDGWPGLFVGAMLGAVAAAFGSVIGGSLFAAVATMVAGALLCAWVKWQLLRQRDQRLNQPGPPRPVDEQNLSAHEMMV